MMRRPPRSPLLPYTTLFRSGGGRLSVPLTRVAPTAVVEISADAALQAGVFRHPLRFVRVRPDLRPEDVPPIGDRKSTRLNSSHANISYAVFCLKKKKIDLLV